MRVPGSDTCTCCFFTQRYRGARLLLYTSSIVCISDDRYWSPAFPDASSCSWAFKHNELKYTTRAGSASLFPRLCGMLSTDIYRG